MFNLSQRKNYSSSSWIFLEITCGIGCLDFLGLSSIDLTLSLDFQGVGKSWNSRFYLKFKLIRPNPSLVTWILAKSGQYQQAISRKSQKWAWNKLDILEYPSKVELGFSRNSNFIFPAGIIPLEKIILYCSAFGKCNDSKVRTESTFIEVFILFRLYWSEIYFLCISSFFRIQNSIK